MKFKKVLLISFKKNIYIDHNVFGELVDLRFYIWSRLLFEHIYIVIQSYYSDFKLDHILDREANFCIDIYDLVRLYTCEPRTEQYFFFRSHVCI